MAKGATIIRVIYLADEKEIDVLCGLGDMIIATDWAENCTVPTEADLAASWPSRPIPGACVREEKAAVERKREHRSGHYAASSAPAMGPSGTELGWEQCCRSSRSRQRSEERTEERTGQDQSRRG
jgi:hypothetical protein